MHDNIDLLGKISYISNYTFHPDFIIFKIIFMLN